MYKLILCSETLVSTKVKNEWNYTSTLQFAFIAWCLIKSIDSFTFYQCIIFLDKSRDLAVS